MPGSEMASIVSVLSVVVITVSWLLRRHLLVLKSLQERRRHNRGRLSEGSLDGNRLQEEIDDTRRTICCLKLTISFRRGVSRKHEELLRDELDEEIAYLTELQQMLRDRCSGTKDE